MITQSFALPNKNEPGLLLPLIKGFRPLFIRYFKLAAVWISVLLCLLILVGCSEDWQTLTNPENDDYFRKIEALTFWGNYKAISADGQQLVVVGDRGAIVRSDNGGTSWQAVTSHTKADLIAVVRQGQELVAVGGFGVIVRSVDGGASWQPVTSHTDANLNAVVRQDKKLVAVGSGGTIVRSDDGGASWKTVTSGTYYSLKAVVRQGQELVAVGEGSVIVRSDDGGRQLGGGDE